MTDTKIAYLHARWHSEVVDRALEGFRAEAKSLMPDASIDVFEVPGAFELPLLARRLGKSGRYAAIVATALVVDGGIYRHDFVAQAVVDGLMRAQFETDVPTFSVSLTPHHFQSTEEHIGFFAAHFVKKGAEAARAVHQVLTLDLG